MALVPSSGGLLAPRHRPRVLEEYRIPSSSRQISHTVRRLSDGTWDCSCEDYVYRQHSGDGECRHIPQARQ